MLRRVCDFCGHASTYPYMLVFTLIHTCRLGYDRVNHPPHEKFFSQKDTSEDFLDTPGGYTWHAQPVYWIHLKDTSGRFFRPQVHITFPPPENQTSCTYVKVNIIICP